MDDATKPNVKKEGLAYKYLSMMENMHPHKVVLLFAMIGSSVVFLFLIGFFGFSYTSIGTTFEMEMPKFFVASTMLIISSSFLMARAPEAFVKDNPRLFRRLIVMVLVMGILFAFCQYLGWQELYQKGIKLKGHPAGAFMYVITGLHVIHLAGAMIFLTHLFQRAQSMVKDPVKKLIIETTPYELIKIKMAAIAWHFLDVLWLILFTYFLIVF